MFFSSELKIVGILPSCITQDKDLWFLVKGEEWLRSRFCSSCLNK